MMFVCCLFYVVASQATTPVGQHHLCAPTSDFHILGLWGQLYTLTLFHAPCNSRPFPYDWLPQGFP